MSATATREPQLDVPGGLPCTSEDDMRARVCGLLSALYPEKGPTERRRESRYAFPHLVQLTPVAADGQTPTGETVVVVGKHLSERGLGFYHPAPLPHRRMIASFDAGDGRRHAFLIDLKWCRFIRRGWYESGGRFLRVVEL